MPARDGYHRIVFWQTDTGYALDVGGFQALQASTPEASEEYFNAANGSSYARARRHVFELPVIVARLCQHLRLMREWGCGVKMVALGRSAHQVWQEETALSVIDQRRGIGSFAGALARLESRIFQPAIYQSDNLLAGIPWHCTSVLEGELTRQGLEGYEGPKWAGSGGASVSAAGVLSGVAVLTLELPVGGATVTLEGNGVSGSIVALNRSNGVLAAAAAGSAFTLPASTWRLQIQVSSALSQPRLSVQGAGQPLDPTYGSCLICLDGGVAQPITAPNQPGDGGSPPVDGGGPGGGPGGGTGDGDGPTTCTTTIDCPDLVLISPPEDSTASSLLDDSDVNLSLSAECDGLATFSKTIVNSLGLPIVVSSITFTLGGSPAMPAKAFHWIDCGGVDGDPSGGCDEETGFSSRTIQFQIALDSISSGTYVVTIHLASGEALTFNMIKP